ncbi:MAG: FkbM family methyltransferase [Deltaproteobacteria bacterium]
MIENEPPFGVYQPTAIESQLLALGRRLEPTKFGKRIASFLRSAFKRLRTKPLDLVVIGQNMRLYAGNNACEKRLMVTPQFFDPVELAFLRSRLHPSFVFLDIGCNVGAYSVFVAKNAGPGARVLAVDPNAIVLDRLQFNAAANGLTNIRVVRSAVADVKGEMEFALEESNMGGSSLQLDRQSRGGKTILKVPVGTLADLVEEAGFTQVDAIKIDVEGFEDKVLIPYLRSVPRSLYPKAVIFEANVGSWQNDLLEDLAEAGYRPAVDLGGNGIYLLPDG